MSSSSRSAGRQSPYGRRGSCHFVIMNTRCTGFKLGERLQWDVLFCCDGQYFIARKVMSPVRPTVGTIRAIHYASPSYFWFHMCEPATVECRSEDFDPAQPCLAL